MQAEKRPATVTIFTRPGCHLCDVAKTNISSSGCDGEYTLEEVNIDQDQAARDLYQYDVPVVLINGFKAFKHEVPATEFKRKLRRMANWQQGDP